MLPLSVLDLIPVPSGSTSTQALQNSLALARRADALGYTRYWLAEHHNTNAFVSTAPELMIALIAGATRRLRVGSGGIMLPNHSPLKVAENFRTLEALYPARIDLGLGRAPGTDPITALALRRSTEAPGGDEFPSLVHELLAYSGEAHWPDDHPFEKVRAAPEDVPLPPLWILGSSGYGARYAAHVGRGFAFAYHFSPDAAIPAMRAYREGFRRSPYLERPHAILGVGVVCAETPEQADELARTNDLMWVRLARGERGESLPSPEEARAWPYSPADLEQVRNVRRHLVVGTPDTVRARLLNLAAETQADELMVVSHIHSHEARVRSYELLAEAFGLR